MNTAARRAASISLLLVFGAVLATGLPLALALALDLALLLFGRRRFPLSRAVLFFVCFTACELGGVLAAFVLFVAHAGGRFGGAFLYRDRHAALQRAWSQAIFRAAFFVFDVTLEVEGGELAREGPFLLFVRHTSTADTVLAAATVANPNRLLLRYVLKRELLWDPCIDIVGRRLPNAFVSRGGDRDGDLESIRALARGLGPNDGVLIYPEGSRFTPEKLEAARRKLLAIGDGTLAELAERLRATLPPRTRGPLALLAESPSLDVVFLSHVGFEGAASFSEFFRGGLIGRTVRVRLQRFSTRELLPEQRLSWLLERWAEVDEWVSAQIAKEAQ